MRSSQRFKDARRSPSSAKRRLRSGVDWRKRRQRWVHVRLLGYAAKPAAPRKSITSLNPQASCIISAAPCAVTAICFHSAQRDAPSGTSRGAYDVLRVRIMRRTFHASYVWQEPQWRHLSSPPHRHLRVATIIPDFRSWKRHSGGEPATLLLGGYTR